MTKKKRHSQRGRPARTRRIIVRGIKREVPDTRRLARALIALAKERLAQEAAATDTEQSASTRDESEKPS